MINSEKLKVIDAIAHGKRGRIFLSIAKNEKTFADLLADLKMSKSGLSTAIKKLSQAGIITPQFEGEKVHYRLTRIGDIVNNYFELCASSIADVGLETRRIMLSFENISKLMESYDYETFRHLFSGWKIILSALDFERLIDFLDKETLIEEEPKFSMFEDFFFNEEFVCVPRIYDDPEKTVKLEYYLRKQKKLSLRDAEMLATASDQDAIVTSKNIEIIKIGREIGVRTVELKNLENFLKNEKIKVIKTLSINIDKSDFYKTLAGQRTLVFSTEDSSKYSRTDKGFSGRLEYLQVLS